MEQRKISHYKIIREVGSGGMGTVYLAEDTRLGRKIALKILPEEASSDPAKVGRFAKEARAASALNHPNILTVFDVGELDSHHYIVTEFVEGVTLRDRLNQGGVTVQNALNIIRQVATALAAAHGVGIVHRDIKPENIMVRSDGLVKVVDFGLAKLAESENSDVTLETTAPGLILGTPKYMSPEQVRGMDVDHRSDIFSLGVVFYELVAGRPPFDGASVSDVIAAVLKEEPRELEELNREVPAPVVRIITECLRKDRRDRYQSMASLIFDLEKTGTGSGRISRDQSSTLQMPVSVSDGPYRAHSTETRTHQTGDSEQDALISVPESPGRSKPGIAGWKLPTALVVVVAVIAAVTLLFVPGPTNEPVPGPQAIELSPTTRRLTTNGKAINSAISPDGKYLAYSVQEGKNESLWVRHVATSKNLEIIPPSPTSYSDLEFSTDSNTIFYLKSRGEISTSEIYSTPVLGGTQKKVVERTNNSFALSPDASQVAFSRFSPDQSEAHTIIANTDGSNERIIDSGTDGSWLDFPSWSPDGSRIVFASAVRGAPDRVGIVEISVSDLQKRSIGVLVFNDIYHLHFRPDGLGILVVAKDGEYAPSQIWEVSYPGGSVRKVTNDLNNYSGASVPADLGEITTIQNIDTSGIWLAPEGGMGRAKQITSGAGRDGGAGICWTPGGQVVYTSFNNGRHDLWTMNADGTNQRQLTADCGSNLEPDVSRDGRYIAFVSNRSGDFHIWRMDIDGNNPIQLSGELPGRFPVWTADGREVIFQPLIREKPGDYPNPAPLWKVPAAGGAAERITEVNAAQPAISPDGKTIAFFSEGEISMMPISGGRITPVVRLPRTILGTGPPLRDFPLRLPYFRWIPDGSGFYYVDVSPTGSSLWAKSITQKAPRRLSDYDGSPAHFSWSPDGRNLAFARYGGASDVIGISGWKARH
jgi:serine/threonine protein kinase